MLSKYKKQIIISAVVLVLLVAALIVALVLTGNTPSDPDDPATSAEPVKREVLFEIPLEDVAEIYVHNTLGEFSVVSETPYLFKIKDFDIAVDDDAMLSLTVFTAAVSYDALVAENAQDLGQYGLENQDVYFTVIARNGDTRSLVVGNVSPDGKGVYVREPDSRKVYLVSEYLSDIPRLNKAAFLSYDLVPKLDTENELSKLSMVRINSETTAHRDIVMQYTASEEYTGTTASYYPFVMIKPSTGVAVNSDYFENYVYKALSGITALAAVAVDPTEEELERYLLTQPKGELELVIDGVSYSMTVSESVNENYCYIRLGRAVYLTEASYFVCLDATLANLQSRFIFLDVITNFSTIVVSFDGKTYRFTQTGTMFDDNDTWHVMTNGVETDGNEFKKLYTLMLSIFIDGMVAEDEVPGEKLLEITYKYADSADEITITYSALDYRRCTVKYNNDEAVYYTMTKYVNKFTEGLLNYLNGVTINLYS